MLVRCSGWVVTWDFGDNAEQYGWDCGLGKRWWGGRHMLMLCEVLKSIGYGARCG